MSIFVSICPNTLLVIGWLVTLRIHNVRMSDEIYKVFENQTNWKQAADTCLRLNGTLIDSCDFHNVKHMENLSDDSSYWTSNFTFMTQWVQLKGCYRRTGRPTEDKVFDKSEIPLGWSCYIYCNNESYFGIGDGHCTCLSKLPPGQLTETNMCPSCNDSSRFQCGKDDYIAVYEIEPLPNSTGNNLCASFECAPPDTLKYIARPCTGALPASCTGGTRISDNKSWREARIECENINSYMLQPSNITCNEQISPAWGNRHREITWSTTEIELLYGIQIHRNHQLLKCSSVSGNKMRYDDCNSDKDGFICKIGTLINDSATTLCNISIMEPETSTLSSMTMTSDPTPTTFSTSDSTKHISQVDAIERNNTATGNNVIYIAIGAAVGGFLVAVLIIVVIICKCRNRSHGSNVDDKTDNDEKKDIDIDDGQENHIVAAERYISIKSQQASVKYTTENSKVTTKTSGLGEAGDRRYEQIDLPSEEPDSGFQDGIVDNIKETQPNTGIHQTSNSIQNTEEEDDYAVVDNESVTEGDIPEIRLQTASIKTTKISDQQETEDDYDHFKQSDQRQSVSSNYDHVHLRNSGKFNKGSSQDDFEDYDHFPGAGGRRREVESTYDHTKTFGLRASNASMSSNYDHVTLLENQNDQDDALNRVSDDYDHTTNVSKVEVVDGNRDSNYTQVILPDSD